MATTVEKTPIEMVMGPFDAFRAKAWPYHYSGTIAISVIAGGTPTDPKVAEGWLRTKLVGKDDLVREMVAKVMLERGINMDEATSVVDNEQHLNGFKRDENGLFIEGRYLKACIKEATSVAVAANKLKARGWGTTNKGLHSFVAEHVVVIEDRLPLMDQERFYVTEPSGVMQRFVHTFRGDAIQYEEYCENVMVDFTIMTDVDFDDTKTMAPGEVWAMIWLTAEQQGIGASRSQGFGRFKVTHWERVPTS